MGISKSKPEENETSESNSTEENREVPIFDRPITRDYDIKKRLGQGNFALVRLCSRKSDGENFAVKIIHKKRLQNNKQQKALQREVQILNKVDHRYCVHLEAIYETTNHLYLVLEYCAGGELFDMICQQNHFTEQQAVKVVTQVTEALDYLHSFGIVHRDIKPENILLEHRHPDSIVKLTDFGLANHLDGSDLVFWTSCGTLYYAAPEVLSTDSYNEKIDFWSLGVVMYVLLVGYLPFYHDNRTKTIELIRRARVPFDMTDWRTISSEARDLIRKLLVFDPVRRYDAKQILKHDWITGGNAGDEPLNLQKLKEFENWRGNFNDHIITMMGLQRWKAYALEQDPEVSMAGMSEGEFDYLGMGVNDAITEAGNNTSSKAVASTYAGEEGEVTQTYE